MKNEYPEFHPSIFKMGYFIVYKGDNSWLTNTIAKEQREEGHSFDNAQYVHVEVSGGGYDSVEVNFPRAKAVDIRKAHKNRYAKLLKYKAPDYNIKRYKIAYWSMSDCGRAYSLRSLAWWKIKDWPFFRKFLKKRRLLKSGLFCSYSCALALGRQYKLHKIADQFMPADFLDPTHFELVWEGQIK